MTLVIRQDLHREFSVSEERLLLPAPETRAVGSLALDSYVGSESGSTEQLPRSFMEQKGVVQIIRAWLQCRGALQRGEQGTAEQDELTRITASMGRVTETLSTLTDRTMERVGLKAHVLPVRDGVPFPRWNTKTPHSTVGKAGENGLNGKYARLDDIHRGTLVVAEGVTAAAFADKLARGFIEQGASGVTATVRIFDSPRADTELRERSRKVIVGFPHTDGEQYTGEIQVHDQEGFARYLETRGRYDAQRATARAEGLEWVAGHVALLGSDIVLL